MSALEEKAGFGSFQVGELALTMPINSIREVVPQRELHALPTSAAYVLGGMDLRGIMVPVVDVRLILRPAERMQPSHCVVVLAIEGKLLGVVADEMLDLFFIETSAINPVQIGNRSSGIFCGSLRCPNSGRSLSLISPQALAELPDMPLVDDTEPERSIQNESGLDEVQTDQLNSLMLMHCAGINYAIDPRAVESTLAQPKLEDTELASGFYLGMIRYRGELIAAVDLCQLTGLKKRVSQSAKQAFVIRMEKGAVALIIDRVVDIVKIDYGRFSAFLGRSPAAEGLISAVLDPVNLPPELVSLQALKGAQYFVLNAKAILANKTCQEMASVLFDSQEVDVLQNQGSASGSDVTLQSRMLTLRVKDEMAVPIEQILKTIPYNPDIEMVASGEELLGYAMDKGENLPVYSLSHLVLGYSSSLPSTASILVAQSEQGKVGFAVESLRSIELVNWRKEVPLLGEERNKPLNVGKQTRTHVEVGQGSEKRMLPVLSIDELIAKIGGENANFTVDSYIANSETQPDAQTMPLLVCE